ncbi:MAG: glycerol-3-phosphate acyltransferase [Planctomycetota bacterium]|nr:glycerol-3-phosphate acyltransferase [Planctomycetota bacterium]
MLVPVLILGALLAGSVPFGLLVARAKGIDLRAHGSGNIGATNAGRVLGARWFGVVFALDFLKGFLPTLGAGLLLGTLGTLAIPPAASLAWLSVGVAAVLGHVFSPWLGFKGGKGVATGAGVLLAAFPGLTVPALGGAVAFFVVLRVARYMSVASMAAAASIPLFVGVWFHAVHERWVTARWLGAPAPGEPPVEVVHMLAFLGVAAALAGLVIWAHRSNIARLRAGTEPRWPRPRPDGPRADRRP